MWDKEYLTPRLTAWYGDLRIDYSDPGPVANPMHRTPGLLILKQLVPFLF
jgi:hypothetical protein